MESFIIGDGNQYGTEADLDRIPWEHRVVLGRASADGPPGSSTKPNHVK